jgi:DNA repair protein RecO (recombination protein O)
MHPLTDTSLIVHWLTEDHGLVRTVAKGARRPKSVFSGRLDLFFGGEIQYQRAKRGDLHALREVMIDQWREGLRVSYVSLLLAGYWCRLLGAVLEPEHPDPELYGLLARGLNHVEADGPSRRALLHFEKELIRLLGMAHDSRPAADILRENLGKLPETRDELWERFSVSEDLFSSGATPLM